MSKSSLACVVSGTSLFVFVTGMVVLRLKRLWPSMLEDEDPERPWLPIA